MLKKAILNEKPFCDLAIVVETESIILKKYYVELGTGGVCPSENGRLLLVPRIQSSRMFIFYLIF